MHRILLLADLHLGSIKDTNYVYSTITEIFDKELVSNKTNAVIILGDFFHRLMKVNEEFISLAINVMSYLIKLCKGNGIKIRVVYGTESHEMSQYRLFTYHLTEPNVDFKIIETVSTEELLPGVNVLYLPEEYVESKQDYYYDYLYNNNHYDYIFGHGIISEGMPMIQYISAPKSNEKKVPHFRVDELSTVSKFYAFGHYHTHVELDGGCYIGSLFRDSFGEEEPKGYGIIENGKFSFIENRRAHVYKTYTFEEDSDIYNGTENLIREIKRIKKENTDIFDGNVAGKIRIIFKTPTNVDPTFKESLRTILFNDKFISPLIKESSDVVAEAQESVDDEYSWILDNSLAAEDKIYRFIGTQYDAIMSLDELNKYINESLSVT